MSEMSVNSKMTAIADGIRALNGGTAALGLDAMATALGVEKTNVEAALAALAEKGVDTSGKGLADIAGLIASIEAGGGAQVATGSVTFAEQIEIGANSYVLFEHNAGFTPRIFLFYSSESVNTSKQLAASVVYASEIMPQYGQGVFSSSGKYSSSGNSGHFRISFINSDGHLAGTKVNEKTAVVWAFNEQVATYITAGTIYNWIAIGDWEGAF